jgi:predicted transcriptional regulator YheO
MYKDLSIVFKSKNLEVTSLCINMELAMSIPASACLATLQPVGQDQKEPEQSLARQLPASLPDTPTLARVGVLSVTLDWAQVNS